MISRDSDGIWQALRRDRPAQLGAALLVAVFVPYLVSGLEQKTLQLYGDLYLDVPLLVFLVVLVHRTARAVPQGADRRFWYLVEAALGCWLVVRIINIAWWWGASWGVVTESDVTSDVLYLGFYLLLAVALETHPHRRPPRPARLMVRTIEAAGALVVVFTLVSYFVIIPLAVNPAAYDTRVPSVLLYATLDGYLVARLTALRYSRPPAPWDRVYHWMLLTAWLWLVTDALEALFWAEIVPWVAVGTILDAVWLPPFATMMVAARIPVVWAPGGREWVTTVAAGRDPLAGVWGGPVALYAVALPLLHFALYGIGALDPVSRGPREVLSFAAIAGLAAMAWLYHRMVEGENRRLAADLRALSAQLHPHFLFNTLNSLAALVGRNAAAAEEGLVRVGALLRYTLNEAEGARVFLREEWTFTCGYLELERLRLGERLSVQAELDEAAAACLVPRFIVQPLAENAVRHGAAAGGAVRIELRAWIERDVLRILVTDDGPGTELDRVSRSHGLGLRGVQAQLEAHYGPRATLDVATAPGAGFRAAIQLPADTD